jgi:hypothetical protein
MRPITKVLVHFFLLLLVVRLVELRRAGPGDGGAVSTGLELGQGRDTSRVRSSPAAAYPRRAVINATLSEEPQLLVPYRLERLINDVETNLDAFWDFKSIWERMGIERDSEGVFDGFVPSFSAWAAEIFTAYNRNTGTAVVLVVSADGRANRRYVVFRGAGTRWRILGNIDILDNKYEGSPHQRYHRVVTNEHNTWLVLRKLGASGTGVYQVNEVWYEISTEHPKPVLEYPIEGYFCNDNQDVCSRAFDSRIVGEEAAGVAYTVKILFSVSYGCDRGAIPGFQKKGKAAYVWNPTLARFVLNEPASELDRQEIRDVYNTGFLSDSKFLAYNFKELNAIAARGDERRSNWVRAILNRIKTSKE